MNCGTLRTEIAVLQAQKSSLHEQLEQQKSTAEALRSEFKAIEMALMKQSQDTQKDLERKYSDLRTEHAIVQEQRQSIQTQLLQIRSEAQDYRVESIAKEAELLQRCEEARRDVEREVLRSMDMKRQSESAVAEAHQQIAELQSCLANLQTKLNTTPAPCVTHEKEIESLKSQILESKAESEKLSERPRSLTARYVKGDLVRMPRNY
jgi:chromosome segregation ATPase